MAWDKFSAILIPSGIVICLIISGWIFQRSVSVKLRKVAQKTLLSRDDILVESLRGLIPVWFLLAGLAIALKTISLVPETRHLFHRFIALSAILSGITFFARLALGLVSVSMDEVTGMPTTLFRNVTAIIVYLLGFLIILDYLGISITPMITALGVGGLAMAPALQDTLSNLFAGIHILITRKIKPGDYVKIASGEEGYVTDISWRNTTLKALPNNMIIVPNSRLAQSIVTNFHLPEKQMAVLVDVGVSHDSHLLRARFREERIEIPFPIRTVYLKKEEG